MPTVLDVLSVSLPQIFLNLFFGVPAYLLAGTYSLTRYYQKYRPPIDDTYTILQSQRGFDKVWVSAYPFNVPNFLSHPEAFDVEKASGEYLILGIFAYIIFPMLAYSFLRNFDYLSFFFSVLMSCLNLIFILAACNLPYRIFGHKTKRKNNESE